MCGKRKWVCDCEGEEEQKRKMGLFVMKCGFWPCWVGFGKPVPPSQTTDK